MEEGVGPVLIKELQVSRCCTIDRRAFRQIADLFFKIGRPCLDRASEASLLAKPVPVTSGIDAATCNDEFVTFPDHLVDVTAKLYTHLRTVVSGSAIKRIDEELFGLYDGKHTPKPMSKTWTPQATSRDAAPGLRESPAELHFLVRSFFDCYDT